jgi:hypothetical protein
MKFCNRIAVVSSFLLIACLCFASCAEKKEGKVIVTEQEFSIRQDTDINWVLDVKGKIRNVGEVDVKKVVITGYCRGCTQVLTAGIWTISDYEKTKDQKDVISYLTAGAEEEFSFREVAFYFHQSGQPPAGLPDMLEVVIESFEVVEE